MVSPFEFIQPDKESPANAGFKIELQLLARDHSDAFKADKGKSLLAAAVDMLDPLEVAAKFILQEERRKTSETLKTNTPLSKDTEAKQSQEIHNARTKANELSSLHNQIEPYVTGGLKTAAMFARGRTGFFWTVTTCALDECKTSNRPLEQFADLFLGSLKGAGMKLAFAKSGQLDPAMKLIPIKYDLPAQAVTLGVATRTINASLTRTNWIDQQTGGVDLCQTGKMIGSQVLNPGALGTDVLAFGVSHGLIKASSRITNLNLQQSPLLSTVLMGTGYGISAGGTAEVLRQQQFNEKPDITKVLASALTQGAVDAIAAIPGGKQADHQANRIFQDLSIGQQPYRGSKDSKITYKEVSESSEARSDNHGKEHHEACCSNNVEPWKRAITLSPLPDPAPAELYGQISARRNACEKIAIYKGNAQTQFETLRDYDKLISRVEVPVRIYYATGHKLEIMVPETHARELDQVRNLRINGARTPLIASKRDGFSFSALPEDFIPRLEELPNSKLVQRINILGHQDPYTAWLRMQKKDPSWTTAADARDNGIITFYEPTRFYNTLQSTLGHEWAHLLHNNRPEDLRIYGAAYRYEALKKDAFNARTYALTNEKENWAVMLGEELLADDPNRFLQAAVRAPIRSAILARAIKWALNDAPQPEACTYRFQLQKRLELIEQRTTEPAVQKLEAELKDAKEPTADQIELLTYLSSRLNVKLLTELARKVTVSDTAQLIVERGAKLLENQPQERFEFLWQLADRDYATAPFAREQFESSDIAQFYLERLARLEAKHKPTDPNLYSRIQDLFEWHRMQQNFKACAELKAKLLSADESLYGPGHEQTETTRMQLGLALLGQGRLSAARTTLERSFESLTKSTSGEADEAVRRTLAGLCEIYEKLSLPSEAIRCNEVARSYFTRLYGMSNPFSATLQARIDSLIKVQLESSRSRP